jgi:biopolymer transport protein ExbD
LRRFSQRNSLVTLSEINITPLLDLAFVLLIIFVITRPLLEQNIDLQLPQGGKVDTRNLDRRNIHVIEVKPNGEYWMDAKRLTLPQLEAELVRISRQNPQLIVDLRGDKRTQWGYVSDVFDLCTRNHITRFTYRTAPSAPPK